MSHRYTLFEDIQGLAIGTIGSAMGIYLLNAAGLVTGGTAGAALLLSYVLPLSFGTIFFWLNLPFFIIAYWKKGLTFTLKGLLAVALVSLMTNFLGPHMQLTHLDPIVTAVIFGVVSGVGMLGLYRHGASLGGGSILGLIAQDSLGIPAGRVQLVLDGSIFFFALFVLPLDMVLYSFLGTVILTSVLTVNHRKDWYVVS